MCCPLFVRNLYFLPFIAYSSSVTHVCSHSVSPEGLQATVLICCIQIAWTVTTVSGLLLTVTVEPHFVTTSKLR